MGNLRFSLLSFILISVISLIFLYPSFFLDFSIDEFSTLVYKNSPHFAGFFRPYGIQLWLFNALYDLIGYNPIIFLIITFFLRCLVALSIVFLVYKLTLNKFAGIFSGLIFALAFTGIQTTSEPVNLNVYLSLISLVFFIWYFLISRKKFWVKNLISMGIFLVAATLVSPIRVNPIFFWALLVDLIWLFLYRSKINLNKFLIRQFLILGIFSLLFKLGIFSYGSLGQNAFVDSAKNTIVKILEDINIINNILIGLGNVIFPNEYNLFIKFQPALNFLIGLFLIFLLMFSFILIFKKKDNYLLIFSFLIWVPIFYFTFWIVSFTASNEAIIFSFRRYLLPAFLGFSISIGILINSLQIKKNFFYNPLFFLLLLLISFHSFSALSFLNYQASFRDGFYSKKIWKQIGEKVPSLPEIEKGKISIFYFELDSSPKSRYSTENFFPGRAAILYNIPQKPYILNPNPQFTYSFEELVSFMKDGEPLKKMGYKGDQAGSVTYDRVFAFRIEDGNLIDIKDEVKERLKEKLNEN